MKTTKNVIFLLIADIIWGVAFVAQRTGGDAVGAYSFNCIRFLIGAVVLLPVIAVMDSKRGVDYKSIPHENRKRLFKAGGICGVALAVASNLQQLGITLGASVGRAGFLTACYILIVPILGIFLGRKVNWALGAGVGLALVGLYLLCFTSDGSNFGLSDILILLCALGFAIQILAIDYFAPDLDSVRFSCIEFLVCGLLSAIPTFVVDMGHSFSGIVSWSSNLANLDAWIAILYAGVLSSGVAYTCQIAGQKNFNPTVASLIMSLESAFSVIAGWLLLHEVLSFREIMGCVVIFVAVVIAQVFSPN